MYAIKNRNHSDGLRRRSILALARTCWSRKLKIDLLTLGAFFGELFPNEESSLDLREITWDEIQEIIFEALTPSVAEELPTIPMELSMIFDFACAARGQWIVGYEIFVVPFWDDEVDPLAPPKGYTVYGISQRMASHLLGYALTLDAVVAMLASKHLEVPAWFPCGDRDYEIIFDRPGPSVQQAIAYSATRMQNTGYYAF